MRSLGLVFLIALSFSHQALAYQCLGVCKLPQASEIVFVEKRHVTVASGEQIVGACRLAERNLIATCEGYNGEAAVSSCVLLPGKTDIKNAVTCSLNPGSYKLACTAFFQEAAAMNLNQRCVNAGGILDKATMECREYEWGVSATDECEY